MSKHTLQACACGRVISTCRCVGPHLIEFTSAVCATCTPGSPASKLLQEIRVRLPQLQQHHRRDVVFVGDPIDFAGFDTEIEAMVARNALLELLGYMTRAVEHHQESGATVFGAGRIIVTRLKRDSNGTFFFRLKERP